MVIRIVGMSDGSDHPYAGKYVAAYDPSYWPEGEPYSGGMLLLVDKPEEALQFDNAGDALELWRKEFGLRPDGKPNRPLTAFTVEVSN